MVHSLTPVLVISSTTSIVTVLHHSLSTFLLDQKRSGEFHCDAGQHNEWLAQRCFDTIKVPNPPFNICNLPTSYLLDREVSDLKERVEKAISPVLLYACRYWGAHLILASPEEGLLNALYEFLSTRLLLWMEILNLNQRIDEGAMTFYKLSQWIQSIKCPDAIRQLILDARIFVAAFSLSPMSDSTPHIYVSLLPFWPEYKPISTRYLKRMPGVVKVNRSTSRKRPGNAVLISKLRASSISILCVACSPDGAYIVSGSSDKTIRIWDAHTGQPVTPPLVGHAGSVYSVAYSPDGSYLVSGSDDKTIRIWNAQTGQPVGQPLSGHTASVDSVAYSPDGAYIVSGSSDDTIRIWNAQSGQSVGQPLMGHTDSVSSVAYSPDSAYVVSGSSDRTIRIWDTHTGQPVGQPLTGHTSLVLSVAYSPNGAYIVSGSDDRTIRIWDTHTWQPRGQPLTGHNELVWSVACSPDDAYIVSADDMIIRIWDAHTGQPVGQPLTGHTDSVYSVAYSPDGAYIVSGSDDGDIYIWATDLEEPIGSRPDSSSQLAQSAIHSPDHSRIISSPAQNDSSASKTATDSTPEQRSEPKGATPLHDGTLNEDGWVVNTNNDRLLWVPPFARSSPQIPRKPVATPAVHQITLDFQDAKFGDEWMHCFDATCVD
ncbi:hypothetical protein FRC08_006487 [Ceratobasidium sp. 394]|nr:hypothetical protein FRC08_006487 [Ceratobasidium sp. 394]